MEKPTLEIISMKIWEIEDIESGKNIPIRTGSINASADRYATFLVTFTNQYEPLLKVPFWKIMVQPELAHLSIAQVKLVGTEIL